MFSNLILILLAIAIVAAGIFFGWMAMYPDKPRSFLNRVRNFSWVAVLVKKYRGWVELLVQNFSAHGAYWLSLISGLALLGLSLLIFGNLLEDVLAKEHFLSFDYPITAFLAEHRVPWLTAVMKDLTTLGQGWLVGALAVVSGIFLRLKTKSWRPLIILAITVAGASLLDLVFKAVVARPRPPDFMMATAATGYAFPSGHTTLTAFYGTLIYLLARTRKTWESKVVIWATGLAIAFLVGVSRVYLGVHWPTDVLGGWALAAIWLSILFTTASVIEHMHGGRYSITGIARTALTPENDKTAAQIVLPVMKVKTITGPDGLSPEQVMKHQASGLKNVVNQRTSRSYRHIFISNIFTRFNALLGSMFVVILFVGSPQDSLFGIILLLNTTLSIIQEVRAKWTLDRLALVLAAKSKVIRSGEIHNIPSKDIVVDDLIVLQTGQQIPVDGLVVKTNNLEVNESLITGESEPVLKSAESAVYSGSYVVAGSCQIQAVYVGEQAYARRLAKAARQFSLSQSELRKGINQILKYVTWLLIPSAFLLFATQILFMQHGLVDAISASIAGVVNMVPDGLVLLTSVVMAAAIIRLAKRRALIQELAAVEVLARVDILCLDKTGTLTEGAMVVERLVPTSDSASDHDKPAGDPKDILGVFAKEQEQSPTLAAIATAYASPSGPEWTIDTSIPFSSERKWSALHFKNSGSWVLGGPEVVLGNTPDIKQSFWSQINQFTSDGKRVLILAYTRDAINPAVGKKSIALPRVQPIALIILQERLRQNVSETLRFFKDQGVALKIISGDSPRTVVAVAAAAGIPDPQAQNGQYLPTDQGQLGEVVESHHVFGRVSPEQKKQMIVALQKRGHVVAMIGDGVNDILAIKEADFGIAMGAGTESNRAVAQLILLDNNFNVLPGVIAEGRRIIANIERTANLFITKTAYVFAMALAVGLAQVPFPFLPRHLNLIGSFTIGIPALFLALAKNTTRPQRGFVARVLRFSFPAGGVVAAATLIAYALARQIQPDIELARTAATLTLLGCGLSILFLLARLVSIWHKTFMVALILSLAVVLAVPFLRSFFGLIWPPPYIWVIVLIFSAICFMGINQVQKKRL